MPTFIYRTPGGDPRLWWFMQCRSLVDWWNVELVWRVHRWSLQQQKIRTKRRILHQQPKLGVYRFCDIRYQVHDIVFFYSKLYHFLLVLDNYVSKKIKMFGKFWLRPHSVQTTRKDTVLFTFSVAISLAQWIRGGNEDTSRVCSLILFAISIKRRHQKVSS